MTATGRASPSILPCDTARIEPALRQRIGGHRFLELHLLLATVAVLCPETSDASEWEIWDAVAVWHLDEYADAHERLFHLRQSALDPTRRRAAAQLGFMYLNEGDEQAFSRLMLTLPADLAWRMRIVHGARLGDLMPQRPWPESISSVRTAALYDRYRAGLLTRRPWLAASLSAILPGAGQAYAGSWQGAAVSFVFNALLGGATYELAHHHLYLAAGAAGLATSFFYVGGMLNARDLAMRRNEQETEIPLHALERELVPEILPF